MTDMGTAGIPADIGSVGATRGAPGWWRATIPIDFAEAIVDVEEGEPFVATGKG